MMGSLLEGAGGKAGGSKDSMVHLTWAGLSI